jgi:hypothetical protein
MYWMSSIPFNDALKRTSRIRRNYVTCGILLALLLSVHFVIALSPNATRSVSQAAVFSWTGLAVIAPLGLIGVLFLNLGRLKGRWDADLTLTRKLVLPAAVGLAIGVLMLLTDLMTGWSQEIAHRMHLSSIHIPYPLSIPIYFGGAILVSILYFLVLLPPLVWLISDKLLKGKHEDAVYWSIAVPLAFVEPWTQGDFSSIVEFGWRALPGAVEDLVLNFAQVWFLRRVGFVAACVARISFYAVWHVIYGLIST